MAATVRHLRPAEGAALNSCSAVGVIVCIPYLATLPDTVADLACLSAGSPLA